MINQGTTGFYKENTNHRTKSGDITTLHTCRTKQVAKTHKDTADWKTSYR